MFTKENIENKILDIMKNQDIKVSTISNPDFIKDLGIDSLDLVELIMTIEKIFNIIITDEEAEEIKRLDDIVKLVYDKTAATEK